MRTVLLLIAAALALPGAARAQALTGPYVGFGAGAGILPGEFQGPPEDSNTASTAPKFDPGPTETGSVGYGFVNGFRVEVEGMHQTNRLGTTGSAGP